VHGAIKTKHLNSIEAVLLKLLNEPEKYDELSGKIEEILTKIFNHEFLHDFKNKLCVLCLCSGAGDAPEFLIEVQKTIAWLDLYRAALHNSLRDLWKKIVKFTSLYEIKIHPDCKNTKFYSALIYYCLYCPDLVKEIYYQAGELKIIGVNIIPQISPGLVTKLLGSKYNFLVSKKGLIITLKNNNLCNVKMEMS
jgi:hypothetical protein